MIKKFVKRYTDLPVQARAAFWFLVCGVIHNGCRFISMPFLTNLLTPEEYGIYSVYLSWVSFISIFATLKLDTGSYTNAMFKYADRRDSYTSAIQSLSIVMTIATFAVYLLFRGFWDDLIGLGAKFTTAIFIQLLFEESHLLWASRQRYEYEYKNLLGFTCCFSLLYLVIPVAAAAVTPLKYRLAAVIYSGVAVQAAFGLIFLVRDYLKGKSFYNKDFWSFAFKFNILLVPHFLSGNILGQSDRVMIERFIGAAKAGIYSVTYNISFAISIVNSAVNSALVPYVYEKLGKREFSDIRRIMYLLSIMIGVLCLIISVLSPELLMIIAPPEYHEARFLVSVISMSAYFSFLSTCFTMIEFFFEENRFITIVTILSAILNVVLNYLLLPVFGYFSAGYTTLFCYIVMAIAHYIFMSKICREHFDGGQVYNGKVFFAISLIMLSAAMGIILVYNHPIIRYSFVLVAVLVCIFKRKWIMKQIEEIRRMKA